MLYGMEFINIGIEAVFKTTHGTTGLHNIGFIDKEVLAFY